MRNGFIAALQRFLRNCDKTWPDWRKNAGGVREIRVGQENFPGPPSVLMDEHELIQTLGSRSRKIARRSWNCPSDTRIVAYLEQRLKAEERARLEAHLSDCDFCLDVIGGLVRQQRTLEQPETPAGLVAKAADALPVKTWGRVSRPWILVPALAALVVAAVVVLGPLQHGRTSASIFAPGVEKRRPPVALLKSPPQPSEEQYVRKLATPVETVEVLEPQSESVVLRERLRFRWRAVGNAASYEVRVVNAEGDLLWQGQESKPTAQLPPDVSAPAGAYFVWVRAFLNDGRTIKSDPVPFTISK